MHIHVKITVKNERGIIALNTVNTFDILHDILLTKLLQQKRF